MQAVSLEKSLSDTILWLRIRNHLTEIPFTAQFVNRIWPAGTVPRQQEFIGLQRANTALVRLVCDLLETLAASGINIRVWALRLATLGYELPQRIKEIL